MTLRSLCPVLAALSLAPAALAQLPCPPSAWTPQPVAYPYYVTPQPLAPAPSWVLAAEGDRVQVQSADGARATCEGLTVQVTGADPVEVAVDGRQLAVRSGSPSGG